MQSFEYSDEMKDSATMCGKQKEPESDFTELRALLIFLLLRQCSKLQKGPLFYS